MLYQNEAWNTLNKFLLPYSFLYKLSHIPHPMENFFDFLGNPYMLWVKWISTWCITLIIFNPRTKTQYLYPSNFMFNKLICNDCSTQTHDIDFKPRVQLFQYPTMNQNLIKENQHNLTKVIDICSSHVIWWIHKFSSQTNSYA